MKLGFIILAHQHLDRVEQLARHLAEQGCPICIHIDHNVPASEFSAFANKLSDLDIVTFSKRTTCEWGRFSIVQATLDASGQILKQFPNLTNVFLISGSCLPIRPVKQLQKFLQRRAKTDFIESVSVRNNLWVKGGLNEERFTLYFPFSWSKQRRLFDGFVGLQRGLSVKRKLPEKLVPHIGSQWWCLTTRTLRAIIDDPRRQYYDSYFGLSWIPDESYFQTLARLHSAKIESRSLTFSKFDFQGKPFNVYDDHLQLLVQSDCFMARKVWSGADGLYNALLNLDRTNQPMTKAKPKEFDAHFEAADRRRCEGGVGRFHQGRFPYDQSEKTGVSPSPYTVFVGFRNLYEHFPNWVEKNTDALAYGNIFARIQVGGRKPNQHFAGNLPAITAIRNRNPKGYLANLLWMNRQRHQSLLYDFRDDSRILKTLAHDKNATVVLIRHSWLLLLLKKGSSFENTLANANRFHHLEQNFLEEFNKPEVNSELKTIELEAAVRTPSQALRDAISHIPQTGTRHLNEMPTLTIPNGLETLVRNLRNNGLKVSYEQAHVKRDEVGKTKNAQVKPYVVK